MTVEKYSLKQNTLEDQATQLVGISLYRRYLAFINYLIVNQYIFSFQYVSI